MHGIPHSGIKLGGRPLFAPRPHSMAAGCGCQACCAGAAALHSAASPGRQRLRRGSARLRWNRQAATCGQQDPGGGRYSNASSRASHSLKWRPMSSSIAIACRTTARTPDTSARPPGHTQQSQARQLRQPMPPRHHTQRLAAPISIPAAFGNTSSFRFPGPAAPRRPWGVWPCSASHKAAPCKRHRSRLDPLNGMRLSPLTTRRRPADAGS